MLERDCVHCGTTLPFREWGPGRLCPACGRETVRVNIKEIHVTFSESHSQSFECFITDPYLAGVLGREGEKYRIGIDYHRFRFEYELRYGDISDPPYSNANVYAHRYRSAENARAGYERQKQVLDGLDASVPVYLWLDDDGADSLLNLLYAAPLFLRFEHVFLVKWEHTEQEFDGARDSMLEALRRRTPLSRQELCDLSARFSEIRSFGAECLLGNGNGVEPWPFSRIEEYVLAATGRDYRYFGAIYSDVYDAIKRDTSFDVSYSMVKEAVHRLLMTGRIQSRGDCAWWGDPHYNCEIGSQSFARSRPRKPRYTRRAAADIVCDAFEVGYTYPLYGLLADGVTLTCEDRKEPVVGKERIIAFLENDGVRRVHSLKNRIVCSFGCFHYDKNKGYAIVGALLFLGYYKEEMLEDRWFVNLVFEGDKVGRIEMRRMED